MFCCRNTHHCCWLLRWENQYMLLPKCPTLWYNIGSDIQHGRTTYSNTKSSTNSTHSHKLHRKHEHHNPQSARANVNIFLFWSLKPLFKMKMYNLQICEYYKLLCAQPLIHCQVAEHIKQEHVIRCYNLFIFYIRFSDLSHITADNNLTM